MAGVVAPEHLRDVAEQQCAVGDGLPEVGRGGVLGVNVDGVVVAREVGVSLSAKFLRPVPVDSEVTIEVKIAEKIERFGHVKAKVYVYRGGKMACGGEAVVIPPKE
ncbi:MAG: hypothetical protein AAFU38_17495 [Bacteroidota bacterium]